LAAIISSGHGHLVMLQAWLFNNSDILVV